MPRLGFRLARDARAVAAPCLVQGIYLKLAVEIDPDHHWRPHLPVIRSKSIVGQEKPAVPPGNLTDPALLSAPVLVEAEALLVVLSGLAHISDGYLGHSIWKTVVHCGSATLRVA